MCPGRYPAIGVFLLYLSNIMIIKELVNIAPITQWISQFVPLIHTYSRKKRTSRERISTPGATFVDVPLSSSRPSRFRAGHPRVHERASSRDRFPNSGTDEECSSTHNRAGCLRGGHGRRTYHRPPSSLTMSGIDRFARHSRSSSVVDDSRGSKLICDIRNEIAGPHTFYRDD